MASISSPSSLATFPYSQASTSRLPHIALGRVHGNPKLAVAAVRGDGVWIYDIKTLRPTNSYTVPPSTVFGSAPVAFGGVVAVVVHQGEGISESKGLWVWKEDERKSVVLPSPAHSVHARGGWPLVVVGVNGGISVVNEDLEVRTLVSGKAKAPRTLAAGIVDGLTPRLVVVDERGRANVFGLEVESCILVGEGAVSGSPLLTADVGSDGTITAIDNGNRVHSRSVKSIVDGTGSSGSVTLAHPSTPACIVSLPSTSHPLAVLAVPSPTPSVAIVVPSPDLPAVLASTPVSTATSNTITHLAIISATENSLTLGTVLSHPGTDGSGRSVIHVADISLPANGVGLSLLVGCAGATAKVFKTGATPAPQPSADRMVEAVTAALRTPTAESVPRAEKAFSSWLDEEDKAVVGATRRAPIPEGITTKLLQVIFSAALKDGKKTGVYPAKIVQTLVDRRVVNDSMWEGGVLLGGFVPLADWRNLSRMLRVNASLPSSSSVALIAHSLKEGTPELPTILNDLLSGPSPDPSFRTNLRSQLTPDDALTLLKALSTMAEEAVENGDGLNTWPERIPSPSPPLGSIVKYISFTLDAHLPGIMGIAGSEETLSAIQNTIAPLIAAQGDYRRLRAPIDAAIALGKAAETGARRTKGLEEGVGKYRVEDIAF